MDWQELKKIDNAVGKPRLFSGNTTIHIQYEYPNDVIDFAQCLPNKLRAQNCSEGKILLDGKRMPVRRSIQLRPFFADGFGWGCNNENAKITALEICCKIFFVEKHALKLYTAFLDKFVKEWQGYKGSVTINITDFLIDHYHRCSDDLETFYYVDNSKFIHEVDIWHDRSAGTYTSQVEGEKIMGSSRQEVKDKISLRLAKYILRT